MKPFSFNIDLPVRSQWENVDLLRNSVQNCLTTILTDIDGCQAIAMIVAELLENAIKHGAWQTEDAPAFRLRVWSEGRNAFVSVENPVHPGANALDGLNAVLDFIRTTGAEEAYMARMVEVASNPQRGMSGLGLVRVAYEGRCTLKAEASADGANVTVIAEMAL